MYELVNPGERMLLEVVHEFVEREVMQTLREIEDSTHTDFEMVKEVLKKMLGLGLQGGFLP
ncbi:MAG: acyl-CoA dehydrogenase family protein [Actinomycetota bacterium]|nr:acyl-CoA dehydrogenase family protein [Actinomycetota bacterium]